MTASVEQTGLSASSGVGAPQFSWTDVARALPGMLPDSGSVVRGLALMRSARPHHKLSVAKAFQRTAHRHPERPFLRFHTRDLSYAEANYRANRIAEVLRRQGVRRGDVVGVLLTNRVEVVLCALAISKLGASAGMLNHHQRGAVLGHSLGILSAKVALVGAECAEALESLPADTASVPVIGVDTPDDLRHAQWAAGVRSESMAGLPWLDELLAELGATAGATDPAESEQILGTDIAFYVFTSGTTGMPKASAMSHFRWMKALAGLGHTGIRLRGDDVLSCSLPMYHNNALTVALGCVIASGACLAIEERFSASRFWDAIDASRATAFIYIGELCRYLLNQEPSPAERNHSVRLVLGNGLRPEIWGEFQERFGIRRIREFYAASEGNLLFVNAFDLDRTAGYCPLPYKLVEYDEETGLPNRGPDGRVVEVPKAGVGLLITKISSRQPFDGYTDAEATERKIVRDAFVDGDAWFISGDLLLDQGLHHASFVDRLGDTFRWKGENVATSEVEGVVAARPEIDQAAVYGVALQGADGRAGMAAIRLHDGAEFDGAALAKHVREHLPSYAVPQFVRIVAELEHTSTYKSRKSELRDQGIAPEKVQDPLYVLTSAQGYVPTYDGAERDVVEGCA